MGQMGIRLPIIQESYLNRLVCETLKKKIEYRSAAFGGTQQQTREVPGAKE
jgi:hypothetical protein